jgi:hypothetical protein
MYYTTTCRQKVLHGDSLRNIEQRAENVEHATFNRDRANCNMQHAMQQSD